MLNYDFIFMAQGIIDQIYLKEQLAHRGNLSETLMVPFAVLLFFITYALSAPTNQNKIGDPFSYPLYTTHWLQMAYTIGSWNWIYINIWVAIAFMNSKFNEYGYKLINGSSMWAYVSHYLFIVIVEKFVVRANGMTFVPAFLTAFSLTEVAIVTSYLMLTYVFGFSSKKDKAAGGK